MTVSTVSAGGVIDPSWGNSVATAINNAEAAWTTGTPFITNVTLGNGTMTLRYRKVGKTVDFIVSLTFGSTTAVGGNVSTLLPFAASNTAGAPARQVGAAYLLDSGTREQVGSCRVNAGDTTLVLLHAESGNAGVVNATNPHTWATGDEMIWRITYETDA